MSLSNDMYPLVDRQTDNYNYTYDNNICWQL